MTRSGSSAGKPAAKSAYDLRVTRLTRAIEVAEKVLGRADLPAKEKQTLLGWCRQLAHLATKPTSPKLRTIRSLEVLEDGLLGYWNETTGPHVDAFWRAVADRGLDLPRRDPVRNALERRRIKSLGEYEAATAVVSGKARGTVSSAEVVELKRLIGEYQRKQR